MLYPSSYGLPAIDHTLIDPGIRTAVLTCWWEAPPFACRLPFVFASHVVLRYDGDEVCLSARDPGHARAWVWVMRPELGRWAYLSDLDSEAKPTEGERAWGDWDAMLADLVLLKLSDFEMDDSVRQIVSWVSRLPSCL